MHTSRSALEKLRLQKQFGGLQRVFKLLPMILKPIKMQASTLPLPQKFYLNEHKCLNSRRAWLPVMQKMIPLHKLTGLPIVAPTTIITPPEDKSGGAGGEAPLPGSGASPETFSFLLFASAGGKL